MSLAQYNDRIRNTADYLFFVAEVISPTEYGRIQKARREAFEIVRIFFKNRLESELNKSIKRQSDTVNFLQGRLKIIDAFFDDIGRSRILDDIKFEKYPPTPINLDTYLKVMERHKNKKEQEPFLENGIACNTMLPIFNLPAKKKLDTYLETALLYDEREIVHALLERRKLSKSKIFQRYHELIYIDGLKTELAYDRIEKWLLDELKYQPAEIKTQFNITLSKESFIRNAQNQKI